MAGYQNNTRTDRFGNPTQLKRAKAKKDRKSGEILPIYQTYVEVGGKLLKVEISDNKKDYPDGLPSMWVKFTSVKKQQQNRGGF